MHRLLRIFGSDAFAESVFQFEYDPCAKHSPERGPLSLAKESIAHHWAAHEWDSSRASGGSEIPGRKAAIPSASRGDQRWPSECRITQGVFATMTALRRNLTV